MSTLAEKIYFPTCVWTEHKPEFLKITNKLSDKYIKAERKAKRKKIKEKNDFGMVFQAGGIEKEPDFEPIRDYIMNRSWEFLLNQGFDLDEYSPLLADMWVQEFSKKGGGFQATHVHSNTHVSGFYFLKCSPNTSYPIFHDPRPGSTMSNFTLKSYKDVAYGTIGAYLVPTPGTVMFFNSYLPHEFPVDHGKEPFRFLHFNIQVIKKELFNVI